MTCRCGARMALVLLWDEAFGEEYTFRLFACESCARVCKLTEGEGAGELWIDCLNTVEKCEIAS